MGMYFLKKIRFKSALKLTFCAVALIYAILPVRFAVEYDYIPNEEIQYHLVPALASDAESCPLIPKLGISDTKISKVSNYDPHEYAAGLEIQRGGWWKPNSCKHVHDVAIVVPFRGRLNQLKIFLHYIHPFLQKQLIRYRIFVIEQTFAKEFNRGYLLNVGFVEALKIRQFHCFIFHDVDLLPVIDLNMYACTNKPRHMCAAINSWRYKLKYLTTFGGVVAILQHHFSKINGFSNKYFGWGGEDDDLMARISGNKLGYCRFSPDVSRYRMLHHKPEEKNPERLEILQGAQDRFKSDGISSLNYTKLLFDEKPLYTHILVDLH